jgi:colicin import membrane protein
VPKVEPRPEPKPEPRPEPKVEQPDIALEQEKKRLEEERKAREAEAERQRKLAEQKKLEEQKLAEQRKLEEQKKLEQQKLAEQKRLEEQKKAEEQKRLAEEKRRLEQQNRQRMANELDRELSGKTAAVGIPGARITGPANVAGATSGDTDAYRARIAAKIKGNVILPLEVVGNPTAEFDVKQLPTGEVIDVKLRKSSGNRTLDEAWERAIRKSSPLPKPDQPEAFRRELTLRFRPND